MTMNEIYSLVCCKLNPLQEKINLKYKDTEEYKSYKAQEETLEKYRKAKKEFEDKYVVGNFDYFYDVFLNLAMLANFVINNII